MAGWAARSCANPWEFFQGIAGFCAKVGTMKTDSQEIRRVRDLSPQQWRSGVAAWLGWMFDGLDMHIYTLVSVPFVASLMHLATTDPQVGRHGAIINAAFLIGWALGGAFFGRVGDLLGRSKTLCLTILTYAAFTGLSFFATEWWHLMGCRFLSALGIGGEWAVGASLLSETWPKRWRPWIAATLQCAINIGVLLACLSGWLLERAEPRWIFLVGVLPAFIVLWIRHAVPETEEWHAARNEAGTKPPGVIDLFRGAVFSVTWRVLAICGVSLTAHWTFMYWFLTHVRKHPEVISLDPAGQNHQAVLGMVCLMGGSLMGNFFSGWMASLWGYRRTLVAMMLGYFAVMFGTYSFDLGLSALFGMFTVIGFFQGLFGLFTMALPPVFPTLLRTTGAGFCYNFGRIAAAAGTVFFGFSTPMKSAGDYRLALVYASFLFIPAALLAMMLPQEKEEA